MKNSLLAESSIPADSKKILADFDKIISSTHPLNSKQRTLLPKNILELSHTLTDERTERRLGYMNQPATLSAYTHYYLWWNLVRLTRLFSNLPAQLFNIKENSTCLDLGSGPLTVPIAILLARPELRSRELTWYCMDISSQALSIGENLLLTVSARLNAKPWKIIRVKGNFGTAIKEKASFISCANVFNEIREGDKMPPDYLAKKYVQGIFDYATNDEDTKILVIEPGTPPSSRLLSLMRDSFMRMDYFPISPCTHCSSCPMDGKKGGKWCNFAFTTEQAPYSLKKLSEKARLPKERAVLSFVAVSKDKTILPDVQEGMMAIRITSDVIRLPENKKGYYACSEKGLLLVLSEKKLYSGSWLLIPAITEKVPKDKKTGALVVTLA
ncbi:MAG: hypothetical protein J6Y69_10010 [Treponema sp.]|nr:hypothetical protein [Treponema sp.]